VSIYFIVAGTHAGPSVLDVMCYLLLPVYDQNKPAVITNS